MNRKSIISRIIVVLLSTLLMVPGADMEAFAEDAPVFPETVTYLDENGHAKTLRHGDGADGYKVLFAETDAADPLGDGWYVAWAGGSVTKRTEVTGDARIILMNGVEVKYDGGLHVPEGKSLSIYGQTEDRGSAGKLIAVGDLSGYAGIGGNYSTKTNEQKCGTINIFGGVVEATGGKYGAGIGGGKGLVLEGDSKGREVGGDGGVFNMTGGWVTANGGNGGAGIGGGYTGDSGEINISGGTITATGGGDDDGGGAGIGGGEGHTLTYNGLTGGSANNITISGGTVKAFGTGGGAGIGAGQNANGSKCIWVNYKRVQDWIKINGDASVYAKGSDGGAGIGGAAAPLNDWYNEGAGANVEISGNAVVSAIGGSEAAGIGAARSSDEGSGQTLIKGNAVVKAYGGDYAAGIGTGNCPDSISSLAKYPKLYDIQISGNADVTSIGGKEGAGIGCGNEGRKDAGNAGDIKISGKASVTAIGGKNGAGIGGGDQQVNGNIEIGGDIKDESGHEPVVTAEGGSGAAGIGSGDDIDDGAGSGPVTIKGGTVKATGGDYGAGIGGADGSDMNGKITILGGKVTAKAVKEASGIGGGNYWTAHGGGNGCDVSIELSNKNDYVLAVSDDDSAPIGHGDSGDSDGSLTLGNEKDGNLMSIKSKDAIADLDTMNAETPVEASARTTACQNDVNKSVLIQYCRDSDKVTYTSKDKWNHEVRCPYCDYNEEESHITDEPNGLCSKCGGEVETFEIEFWEGAPPEKSDTKYIRKDAYYELPDYEPAKVPDGQRFAGWSDETEPSAEDVQAPSERARATWNTRWTAVYGEGVTISFDAGEGSGTMSDISAVKGMTYYLPEHGFEGPYGAKFLGWSDDSGETYESGDRYTLKGNVVFTAQWEGHRHKMTHHNAVAATCEKDGNCEYWECQTCRKLFKDSEGTSEYAADEIVIPATDHYWAEATYTWSDDNSSVTAEVVCLNDYKHKKTETVKTTSSTKKQPTCSEEGETEYKAEFKKDAFETKTKTVAIDKMPHNWPKTEDGKEVWDAGEDENTEQRVCPDCGTKEERAKGHKHQLEEVGQVDPTCKESGMKAHYACSECGKWYADDEGNQMVTEDSWRIPATGHKLGSPEQYGDSTAATCEDPGNYKTIRRCTVEGCDFSTQDNPSVYTTPALGHDWNEEITKAATCTEAGLKEFKCRRCGKTKEPAEIPALGGEHEWGDWIVTRAATAKTVGEKQRTCENCGLVELMNIAPTGGSQASAQTPAQAYVNSKTVSAAAVQQALKAAGGNPDTLILGKRVKKISKRALAGTGVKTVVVKTKKLKKKSVKGSLKGSAVTTVKVQVGKAKTNKKYVKKYKKIFTKKNAGKKVKVRK